MATEPELHRVSRDLDQVRSIANYLLNAYTLSLSEWEIKFLGDMTANDRDEHLSYRQVEKLLQIRDDYHSVTHYRGLALRRLVEICWEARCDLPEEDEEFVERLHDQGNDFVRARDVGRLLRCAHRLVWLEGHMLPGRQFAEGDD